VHTIRQRYENLAETSINTAQFGATLSDRMIVLMDELASTHEQGKLMERITEAIHAGEAIPKQAWALGRAFEQLGEELVDLRILLEVTKSQLSKRVGKKTLFGKILYWLAMLFGILALCLTTAALVVIAPPAAVVAGAGVCTVVLALVTVIKNGGFFLTYSGLDLDFPGILQKTPIQKQGWRR